MTPDPIDEADLYVRAKLVERDWWGRLAAPKLIELGFIDDDEPMARPAMSYVPGRAGL